METSKTSKLMQAMALTFACSLSLIGQVSGISIQRAITDPKGNVVRHMDPSLNTLSQQVSATCDLRYLVEQGDTCVSIIAAFSAGGSQNYNLALTLDSFTAVNQEYDPNFTCGAGPLTAGNIICVTQTLPTAGSGSNGAGAGPAGSDPQGSQSTETTLGGTAVATGTVDPNGASGDPSSTNFTTLSTNSTQPTNFGCLEYSITASALSCPDLSKTFQANVNLTGTLLYYFQRANPAINCLNPVPASTRYCSNYNFDFSTPSPMKSCTKTVNIVGNVDTCQSITAQNGLYQSQLSLLNMNFPSSLCTGVLPMSLDGVAICVDAPGIRHVPGWNGGNGTVSSSITSSGSSSFFPSSSSSSSSGSSSSSPDILPPPPPVTSTSDTPTDTPPASTTTTSDPPPPPPPDTTSDTPPPPPATTTDPPPVTTPGNNGCASCEQHYGPSDDYVAAHNWFRSFYNNLAIGYDNAGQTGSTPIRLSPMTGSQVLADHALNSLYYLKGQPRPCRNIEHDENDLNTKGEGENLAWAGYNMDVNAEYKHSDAINTYMDEAWLYFSYSNGGLDPTSAWNIAASNQQEIGHFTQMMWASSNSVGCAKRLCELDEDGQHSWVAMQACRYQARGNLFTPNLLNPFYN